MKPKLTSEELRYMGLREKRVREENRELGRPYRTFWWKTIERGDRFRFPGEREIFTAAISAAETHRGHYIVITNELRDGRPRVFTRKGQADVEIFA